MNATQKTAAVQAKINRFPLIEISFHDAAILRRAEMTLHRWGEGECGDSNNYSSWCIVRDDDGKTYREVSPHTGKNRRYRIADKETGALRRIAAVCKANGLEFFHQTDCRGCALFVAPIGAGMTDCNYSSVGRAVCA